MVDFGFAISCFPPALCKETPKHTSFIGFDLTKNTFAVHSVDDAGKPALVRPTVRRDQLLVLVANLPACTIGLESADLFSSNVRMLKRWRKRRSKNSSSAASRQRRLKQ